MGEQCHEDEKNKESKGNDPYFKLKAGIFLGTACSIGIISGFSRALASTKNSDPKHFDEGVRRINTLHEGGVQLARKALAYGTVLAFTGCGLLFYSVWKLTGCRDLEEFRQKAGAILPKIPKKESNERTEFSGINEFLRWVIEEDQKKKKIKQIDEK